MRIRQTVSLLMIFIFAANTATAGISVFKTEGITVTGTDGVTVSGADGVTVSGADGYLAYQSNGITVSGTDGVTVSGADGVTVSGADGATYTGANGVTVSGADGVTVSGADGVTVSGADGVTVSGADGQIYRADSVVFRKPSGVTVSGADGVTVSGADGVTVSGADGVTVSGADGVTVSGADGITVSGTDGVTVSGADSIIGFDTDGVAFKLDYPSGVTVSGADGVTVSGADGVTVSGADGVTVSGADTNRSTNGLQSVDPELALLLDRTTDDSFINAIIVYHNQPAEADLNQLRAIGILGGTKFERLPFIIVSATRDQLVSVSRLPNVRSLYGHRTLTLNADPYFERTGVQKVVTDGDLQNHNQGLPVSGRNVTVAVLDTGINSIHNDLNGKVVQNVKLVDAQSAPVGFVSPAPVENVSNTDQVSGHGTFVAGIVAGNGISSGGRYNGVAPGANILGLSAGDLNLTHVLSGFDYVLRHKDTYNIRVVNCSFSANTVYDPNDPVNIGTKILTDNNVSVVFSAGNKGSGNDTLNPYAAAPWVVSVGATDERGTLADFSSRGGFGRANPTLVAPGVDIVGLRSLPSLTGVFGAVGSDRQRLAPGEVPFYTTASGTSFSAPQVAGAIALMLEANPNLTPDRIRDILSRTATPLPKYYQHEAGAGMLNTYAAVLEAAFPHRRTGLFRSTLSGNRISFNTYVLREFEGNSVPGTVSTQSAAIPANAVQAGFNISWGGILSPNDLGLKVLDSGGNLAGESNKLNLPGLTGKREKVVLRNPAAGAHSIQVRNTVTGTPQQYRGYVEVTTVEYPNLRDIDSLTAQEQTVVLESLRSFMMAPVGSKFRSDMAVVRYDFAEAVVRSGLVPQYVAASPMYQDVRDPWTRSVIESVQSGPNGRIFYDVEPGDRFKPFSTVDRLTAAVALVRAAGLEYQTASAVLSPTVADAASIPAQYRAHVAVALQNGLLRTDGSSFNPNRSLTRLELASALVRISSLSN